MFIFFFSGYYWPKHGSNWAKSRQCSSGTLHPSQRLWMGHNGCKLDFEQRFHSVVVITFALHAKGRGFEPRWNLILFLRLTKKLIWLSFILYWMKTMLKMMTTCFDSIILVNSWNGRLHLLDGILTGIVLLGNVSLSFFFINNLGSVKFKMKTRDIE